jgi:hypothetical protein
MVQAYRVRHNSFRLHLKPVDRINAMAVLRICRQVYHETAVLPYKLNTFTSSRFECLRALTTKLRPYQYMHITSLRFEFVNPNPIYFEGRWAPTTTVWATSIPAKLSSLQHIDIRVFSCEHERHAAYLQKLRLGLLDTLRTYFPGVNIVITTTGDAWWVYSRQ